MRSEVGGGSARVQEQVKHYAFVSSAGAYVAGPIQPEHVEGDARKASAGHVEVETYLEEQVLPPPPPEVMLCPHMSNTHSKRALMCRPARMLVIPASRAGDAFKAGWLPALELVQFSECICSAYRCSLTSR